MRSETTAASELTGEHRLLQDTARQVAARLSSLEPDDGGRGWERIREVGWCGLRSRDGGRPLADGSHVGLVAEQFGAALVPEPFLGATLGTELLALAEPADAVADAALAGELIAVPLLASSLSELWNGAGTPVAWDAAGASHGVMLQPVDDGPAGWWGDVCLVDLSSAEPADAVDPSRVLSRFVGTPPAPEIVGRLARDDMARWQAFSLALIACELVGVMDAAFALGLQHASDRSQYGRRIGSFQAIQHLCADQLVSIDAARSAAYHAVSSVDDLPPQDALLAARVAKVYCSQAALRVTEAVIQIHGGIGMTWECDAHRFLRRALLDRQTAGGEVVHLAAIADRRMGVPTA